MASPHIAGLAALILPKHPNWSPMEVKSAMMTTARDLTDTTNPLDQGAGFVVPREFLDPGLVYDSDFDDWSDYLAGQGVTYEDGTPFTNTPRTASDLNVASIAVNSMAGKETVKRSVTNVDNTPSTYQASIVGLPGIKTTVKPSTLTLAPGQTGTFKVTFTRGSAAFGAYKTGTLFWKDDSHIVRSPIVVNPSAIDAPTEVSVAHNKAFTISTKAGFDGRIRRTIRGAVPAVDTAGEADASGGAGDPTGEANYFQDIDVPGPGPIVRVQTLPDFPADDLDVFLLDGDGNLVAYAATGASAEEFTVSGLPAGTYTIAVEAYAVHGGGPSTTFTVRTFSVRGSHGNLTLTPKHQDVTPGASDTWSGKTNGLDAGTPYLGVVRWYRVVSGGNESIGTTLVSIE